LEVGFTIEGEINKELPSSSNESLGAIAKAVESTLNALREALSEVFVEDVRGKEMTAHEVLAKVMELPLASGISRKAGGNIDPDFASLSSAVAGALIRVGQEAIVNAERHSGCAEIYVYLSTDSKTATLIIQDDGVGMLADEPYRASRSGGEHLGIMGMQDAVNSVGGVLTFKVPSIGGTTVSAKFDRLHRGDIS
jgi:signal transduction histidine kinase